MNIEARELTLIFGGGESEMTVAVDNLDLTLRQGELLGVMGPSGSGKSTLLYLLSGLRRPSSGSVFYDDTDISSLGEGELDGIRSQKLGFVFQRHFLMSHLTVLENAMLPLKRVAARDHEYAQELMREMDVWKHRHKRPHQLSVGERQKVAVVRALINRPEVLFADEPTASLDINSAMAVMEILEHCMRGRSVIVVTHDYKILKGAGRILRMRDGKIG